MEIFPIVAFAATIVVLGHCGNMAEGKKLHYIHWNQDNPMFRLDNTDHIVDVNTGNLPWEYDQVNVICPVSKPGVQYPERHVIYSVSREEFDSCRITNPKPKIVAICNKPHRLMYFTITFRSFTPTPGGLEFHPGQDYYFISTSSREDLHRRVGGGCSTHNMKMIFKVSDNRLKSETVNQDVEIHEMPEAEDYIEEIVEAVPAPTTTQRPAPVFKYNSKVPSMRGSIYYYHPRDLIDIETNTISDKKVVSRNSYHDNENEVWGNSLLMEDEAAMRLTAAMSGAGQNLRNGGIFSSTCFATILMVFVSRLL